MGGSLSSDNGGRASFELTPRSCLFGITVFLSISGLCLWFIWKIFTLSPLLSLFLGASSVLTLSLYIYSAFKVGINESPNIWIKAAHSTLLPATVGFTSLSICLIYVNSLWEYNAEINSAIPIAGIEFAILRLNNLISPWAHLNWWQNMLILILLIVIVGIAHSWKLISHFKLVNRSLSFIVACLAVVTSFSFFIDEVLPTLTRQAAKHVTVVFLSSRKRELEYIARYMAYSATKEALESLPNNESQFYRAIFNASASLQLKPEYKHKVIWSLSRRHVPESSQSNFFLFGDRLARQLSGGLSATVSSNEIVDTGNVENLSQEMRSVLLLQPELVLQRQFSAEATAKSLANNEQRLAFEEMLNTSLSLVTDEAKSVALEFFGMIVATETSEILLVASKYIDSVLDKKFEEITEPFVKKLAATLQMMLIENIPTGTSATTFARVIVRKCVHNTAVKMSKYYSDRAKENIKLLKYGRIDNNVLDLIKSSIESAKYYAVEFRKAEQAMDYQASKNDEELENILRDIEDIEKLIAPATEAGDIARRAILKQEQEVRNREVEEAEKYFKNHPLKKGWVK